MAQYPLLFNNNNWTDEQLTNIWNNEALIAGNKLLLMLNDNTPINSDTNLINAWNALTNTPTLNNNNSGDNYLCTVAGSVNFGAGTIAFGVYDIVAFNTLLMQWLNVGQPYPYYWAGVILAHLITLYNRPVVGRLNNATEGDVSGQFDYQSTLNSAWWDQTTYGARCWKLIKQRGGFTAYVNNPYQGISFQGNNNVYN